LCFNGKIVEVRAAKDDSGVRGSGQQADVSKDSCVQTHTFGERLTTYG
jgi:hypothetical protein